MPGMLSVAAGCPRAYFNKNCAQLLQSAQVPHREEGFSLVVRLQPTQGLALDSLISAALERLATIHAGY
mgnify:CR=1 FL=1